MTTDLEYVQNLENIRAEKDQRIRQNPRSWLALIGLFWLQPGQNTIGCDPDNQIVLSELKPHQKLVISLEPTRITFKASPDSGFTIRENVITEGSLQTDHDAEPDLIQIGSLSLMVILRGDHTLLRVWDSNCEQVRQFNGLHYFPIRPDYCIQAKYLVFDIPLIRQTQDAIGNEDETEYAGEVVFTWQNVECHLLAQEDGDELLLNFTDLTRADSTYPAGRYLTIPVPTSEDIILDFNRAANWPCAYTPYATCPIPLRENSLPVRIEAGEMRYHTD